MGYGNSSYGTTTYGNGFGGGYVASPLIYSNTARQDAVWQADENVGYLAAPSQDAVWQADENIVLPIPGSTIILFRLLRRRD